MSAREVCVGEPSAIEHAAEQGRVAFIYGAPLSSNPYGQGADRMCAAAWDRGYSELERLHDAASERQAINFTESRRVPRW